MEITAALAADLAILSEALDGGAELTDSLRQLAADVSLAVRSYLGLSVLAGNASDPLTFTAMEPFAQPGDVVSSLLMPLSDEVADGADSRIVVILYAARGDAFVDLAADLSTLTGRPIADFAIDQHLQGARELASGSGVQAASLVNQAIGVLIGRGYPPLDAEVEIATRAAASGVTRAEIAEMILGSVDPGGRS